MDDNAKFIPVRGPEKNIAASVMGFNDGYLYFATDTGRIYLDYVDSDGTQNIRKPVGGIEGGSGNSGIYYANYSLTDDDKLDDEIYIPITAIETETYPQKDDIIINIPEGAFYRVLEPMQLITAVKVLRLTVAGGGGSNYGQGKAIQLDLKQMATNNFINERSAILQFTAYSATDARENDIDSLINIFYEIYYSEGSGEYNRLWDSGSFMVPSRELYSFDIGVLAKPSAANKLRLTASQLNATGTVTREFTFTTSNLELILDSQKFGNESVFEDPNNFKIWCYAIGNMNKIIEYYFDNMEEPFYTKRLSSSESQSQNIKPADEGVHITHGYHTIAIKLYQADLEWNKIESNYATPLQFEVGISIQSESTKPIIWLGEYQQVYYNYDTIQIPFKVFDPNNTSSTQVKLKKNNRLLENGERTIPNNSVFSYFEISDADLGILNHYSISCGEGDNEVTRIIEFRVEQDPNRTNFKIVNPSNLIYSFDTVGSGRSNQESEAKRQIISYNSPVTGNIIKATMQNFNWNNNGWIMGNDKKTCLRISNGASVSIPIGQLIFAGTSNNQQSNTIELQFKIRNVQNYSNLIHNITRYKDDERLFNYFNDPTKNTLNYTNYDSFLAWYLSTHYEPYTPEGGEERALSPDDLIYDRIQKKIDLNNVFCSYYTGNSASVTGMCLGPQDMFFSNGVDTVSASYVENEIINLSIVYQHGATSAQKLIMIYVNGVLNSVIKNTKTTGFTIEAQNLVFNSNYCDIDLYKIRVYNQALTIGDILMNYAVDNTNVDIYDQNKLGEINNNINEYQFNFNTMIEYNRDHPKSPLMPYIIFDTAYNGKLDKQKLSFSKEVNLNIGVEFVNTQLDAAYKSGEIENLLKAKEIISDSDSAEVKEAAIKNYYKHHCPSWKSADGVNMAVQGTSSEFYPRRNYKLKTKTKYDKDGKNRIHIFLNGGPFATEYEADQFGLKADKYILDSSSSPRNNTAYYILEDGEYVSVTVGTTEYPYTANTYYIENPAYVEFGKEKTRQDYWYMNNDTVGTTKFTMKIDYMESSGSYNMGFANLVKNAYSKHPLDDYNRAGAFSVEDPTQTVYQITTNWESGKTYYYKNHNGNWKSTASDELSCINNEADPEAMFALGPLGYVQYIINNNTGVLSPGSYKVYGLDKDTGERKEDIPDDADGLNTWYDIAFGYKSFTIPNTEDYRTSVAGFRVLAFHKKLLQSGEIYYQYIGMYNMLLDKGSDEVYGFKPENTCGNSTISQTYLDNKSISNIAECWEMENNNRTYCSFRDPDQRKDLSFDVFDNNNGTLKRRLNSVKSAPIVADSFEYRYHKDADALDYIMNPIKEGDKIPDDTFRFYAENPEENQETRASYLLTRYTNWEKACQWVWSTCTDYVPSQGIYEPIRVGKKLWQANTYYLFDIESNEYIQEDANAVWNPNVVYYEPQTNEETNEVSYVNAYVINDSDYIFNDINKLKFYIKVNNEYVSCSNETDFNDSFNYYKLQDYTSNQMQNLEKPFILSIGNYDSNEIYYTDATGTTIAEIDDANSYTPNTYYIKNQNQVDRLVRQCTDSDVYDSEARYYTYDGTQKNGQATVWQENLSEEEFNNNKTNYYVGISVTYSGKEYFYDTKEYRGAKFINELKDHFDIEYMATYFVMTEVFECYDSRGKNCMMASWGPQKQGGDYIWYPIFYDIDTQLGVNNTGIPSFEYNVDATEDGNYSTSDSVLWNNFYKYFKSSAIIMKYKHLKGLTSGVEWTPLTNPPLQSVDFIEGWYNTDPNIVGEIVMRGKRPLMAINLDEYYKYITITNGAKEGTAEQASPALIQATLDGLVGYLGSDTVGSQEVDPNGTYFYMLQGDRSLSRRQFLTNRLDYIDSWLNLGDYSRSGASNYIRGRVNANSGNIPGNSTYYTSDDWIANDESEYFDNQGNKLHSFDSEYWMTLTPTHSSYVTLGDDNEAYPSQKYDGIHPIKFEISAIKQGVLSSRNYREQLFYIYGTKHMSDLGDMSKLYWQEFVINGDASKLTSLKFGYDGLDENNKPYFNYNVNMPSFGAGASAGSFGLPLLKYMNLCNVRLKEGSAVLDLTSCEKLENFRATGSNYSEFKFAEGVALHTLYLPETITSLKLVKARMLTNLLTQYRQPTLVNGELSADPGLYIDKMFGNNATTIISSLSLQDCGLGYDSYTLLKQYYTLRKPGEDLSDIEMTNVVWSPYIQVSEDEPHDNNIEYYLDDGHYGLVRYTNEQYNTNLRAWDVHVANGEVYRLTMDLTDSDNLTIVNQITDSDIQNMFISDFANSNSSKFRYNSGNNIPNISGIMYVNNQTQMTENIIRNTLQTAFPNLKMFFANVKPDYTAKFILMDADEGDEDGTYTVIVSQTIDGVNKTWFDDPVNGPINGQNTNYTALTKNIIDRVKPAHDFLGWATSNDKEHLIATIADVNVDQPKTWPINTITEGQYDYKFYAICEVHKWRVDFYDNNQLVDTIYVANGEHPQAPNIIPYRDDSNLPLDQTYQFKGWGADINSTQVVTLNEVQIFNDMSYYSIWNSEPVSVYNNIHPEWFIVTNNNYRHNLTNETGYEIQLNKVVRGKLTIPAYINGEPVIALRSSNSIKESVTDMDPCLKNVTHVFIEKNDNDMVNLRAIGKNTFRAQPSGYQKLKYVELDANGLSTVGDYAFYAIRNFTEVSTIGGTIVAIGGNSFGDAFNNQLTNEDINLIIDGNIEMVNGSFSNFTRVVNNSMTVQLGTENNRTSQTSFGTPFSSNASKITSIKIYHNDVEALNRAATNAGAASTQSYLIAQLFGANVDYDPTKIEIIG